MSEEHYSEREIIVGDIVPEGEGLSTSESALETYHEEDVALSPMMVVINVVFGLVCLAYLVNPGAGFFELLPDNLPVIGNLDEGVATVILLTTLRNMGIDLFGLLNIKK